MGADEDRASGRFDVVIVGAGLAGLSAARHLRRAGQSLLVLEARSEVGGRTRSRAFEGGVAEFGGEWIGRAHRRARRLVYELGLTLEPAGNAGHPVLWRLPRGEFIGRLPPSGTWRNLARVFRKVAWLGRGISRAAPWEAARASELDAISTAEWFDRLGLGKDTRHILERLMVRDLERLSLLHFLWWTHLAGGPLRTLRTTFQWRVSEGAQEISRRIAHELGDSLRVDASVRRIAQGDEVVVELDGGETCKAQRAIIAVPVSYADRIKLEPPLPERQRELSRLQIGAGTMIVASLPSGHRLRHSTVIGGQGLWGAWRRGDQVTGIAPSPVSDLSDEALRADLERAFRVASAGLRSATVFRWGSEKHIPGCDVTFAPGELCRYGPWLPRPHGRIHFAGTERSSWPNNIEGALESGERTAGEVIGSLPSRRPVAARPAPAFRDRGLA